MLATLVEKPFDSKEWIFEIKWDGFRALAELSANKVELYSRNLQRFNARFPSILNDLKGLGLDAVLDGEIVALDENGVSQFQLLQNNKSEENIYFYVFDILYLDGKDLRGLPLIERKSILKGLLKGHSHVRFLDHVEDKGKAFFLACQKEGLEGIIGKKKKSLYTAGQRSKEWVKIKTEKRQEVVICGFTEPKRSRKNFGALIVGVYKKGVLKFAGHVGGGFTEESLKDVKAQLAPLITQKCPFNKPPKTNTPAVWLKPKCLCEVKFREWTDEGIMRQPIFLGIRTDKLAKSVVKETANYSFVTHADKLYWEKEKITKGDLLNYYASIAPFILPYLKDRPESLRRFPNGIANQSFFQKNLKDYPKWIETFPLEHHDKRVNYLLIQDMESLLYAVNLGCIEIHPWFSRHQSLEYPDFLTFDLDPENISFEAVVETAQHIHAILEQIKVPSFCKTSGSRGLHLMVPLKARYTYEQAQQFAQLIATLANEQLPKITSLERSPRKRQKKVYIDYLQNNFGQTLAAPYSVRAKPGAPVSTPLQWNEVKKGLDPLDYTLFNTLDRLRKKGDILKPILRRGIDMEKALKHLQKLL